MNKEIKTVKSYCENNKISGEIRDFLLDKIDDGTVVFWLNYAVVFGRIKDKKLIFYKDETIDFNKHLIKLRAFNEKKELFIWKSNDSFNYRLRVDESGEDVEYIEAQQILWGTPPYKSEDGFVEAKEDRGVCLIIPFEGDVKNGKRFVLTTRNYIDYNEIGQAGFIDTRFVKIEQK